MMLPHRRNQSSDPQPAAAEAYVHAWVVCALWDAWVVSRVSAAHLGSETAWLLLALFRLCGVEPSFSIAPAFIELEKLKIPPLQIPRYHFDQ